MKILVVNDDGINSPGIKAAVDSLKPIGEPIIIAPATEKSGVGRSISISSPVKVSRKRIKGVDAYSISGTPADAVIIGIYGILKEKPRLVVSGINLGWNMGFEATTSGTVGAALEGASQGVPSLAISVNANEGLTLAKEVLNKLSEYVLKKGLPEGVDLLNVNVPEFWNREIKITRLAKKMHMPKVKRSGMSYEIDVDPVYETENGTDVHALRIERCISITPLKLDFTSYNIEKLETLKDILKIK
jgi:5'-nucleotidase